MAEVSQPCSYLGQVIETL